MKKLHLPFSSLAILLCLAWCIGTIKNYDAYKGRGEWSPFKHDQFCYYAYLPALFVHGGDWDFGFVDSLPENNPRQYQPITAPLTGKRVNKVTYGMSLMFAPAFITAHVLTLALPGVIREAPDGYSQPYRTAMAVSTLLYLALALLCLRRVLRRYFDEYITGCSLLGLVLGTNLFYYAVHENMMSHAYSFFLFSLVMWLGQEWRLKGRPLLLAVLLGLSGLVFLVRPTNLLVFVLPLLWGIRTPADIVANMRKAFQQWPFVLAGLALALALVFPQLLYWKHQSGQWLFFSYGPEERFYWTEPAIFDGLFSYCKGWYVYTPLMFFATLGLIGVWQYAREWFWAVGVFFVLNVYMVLSWWSWWYGGGFGLRAFAESGAVMSLGLAAFLHWVYRQHRFVSTFLFLVLPLCIVLNLFQTFQYKKAYIRWNGMTRERYWKVFGRTRLIDCERDSILNMYKEPSR
jgi:hypothetical protein